MAAHAEAPKWISESEVRSVLTWQDLVPAMSDVLAGVTTPGDTVQPLRLRLHDQQTDGWTCKYEISL